MSLINRIPNDILEDIPFDLLELIDQLPDDTPDDLFYHICREAKRNPKGLCIELYKEMYERKMGMETTKFTILGETGSGKTCYLLGMYYEMSIGVNGYTITTENEDVDRELSVRYERLKDSSLGYDRFPVGTDDVSKYLFNLQYAYQTVMPFEWIDYPGGFLDATQKDTTSDSYKEVERSINESAVLFICVDGANLVGNGTGAKINNVRRKCSRHISPYLGKLVDKLSDEKKQMPPIGIIVTKYDLCAHYTNPDEIKEIVEASFTPLFRGEDTFVAVIPVSLGATIEDDSCRGKLDPINIQVPISMGICIALKDIKSAYQFEKKRKEKDIAWMISEMEEEKDSFFLWRDDEKIARLRRKIEAHGSDMQKVEQILKKMEKDYSRLLDDLVGIDLIFSNGEWK